MNDLFNIAGAKLSFTNLDLDFLVRYQQKGEAETLLSAKTFHEKISEIDSKFFVEFFNRAYLSGKYETSCKLRRGIKVTFVLR